MMGGPTLFYTKPPKLEVTMGEHVRNRRESDMNATWHPTCPLIDNFWWSLGFCDEKTQTNVSRKIKATMLEKNLLGKFHLVMNNGRHNHLLGWRVQYFPECSNWNIHTHKNPRKITMAKAIKNRNVFFPCSSWSIGNELSNLIMLLSSVHSLCGPWESNHGMIEA